MNSIDYLTKEASIIVNLYNSKNFSEAIRKSKIVIKKHPDEILFYNILSLSLSAKNENTEAIKYLDSALNKQPNNIYVLNNLGLIHSKLHIFDKAEYYFQESLKKNPDFFDALLNYGNLFLNKNDHKQAIIFYKKAFDAAKNDLLKETSLITLGNTYQQIGDFESSRKIYKKILQINPQCTKADKAISLIHKYKSLNDEHFTQMIRKVSSIKDKENYKSLSFALGKAYEDLGNFDESFNYLKAANDIEKQQLNYRIENDLEIFSNIKKFFLENEISSINNPNKKIIFVVGMPRSGTTLTEQIISAHKEVFGAGELPYLSEFFNDNINFLNQINNTTKIKNFLIDCQKYYFSKIEGHKINENIIIDKAPLNFKWIGFILAIFPNSKIIHCQRDPMAICWSNYKNSFSSRSIGFSYDLVDLAKFFNLYDDLMNFWKKSFSKNIYNLDYQQLVTNKEIEIKKIINFCELKWDDNCLKPEENKKSVSTASLSQVRSPIYKSSIKNWENYSSKLNVLKEIIKHT